MRPSFQRENSGGRATYGVSRSSHPGGMSERRAFAENEMVCIFGGSVMTAQELLALPDLLAEWLARGQHSPRLLHVNKSVSSRTANPVQQRLLRSFSPSTHTQPARQSDWGGRLDPTSSKT